MSSVTIIEFLKGGDLMWHKAFQITIWQIEIPDVTQGIPYDISKYIYLKKGGILEKNWSISNWARTFFF